MQGDAYNNHVWFAKIKTFDDYEEILITSYCLNIGGSHIVYWRHSEIGCDCFKEDSMALKLIKHSGVGGYGRPSNRMISYNVLGNLLFNEPLLFKIYNIDIQTFDVERQPELKKRRLN